MAKDIKTKDLSRTNSDDEFEDLKFEFFNVINKLQQQKPLTVDPCGGLTQAEANVLHAIGLVEQQNGNYEARPGLIAAHTNVTPSALSQVLKVLEEKNLVIREHANKDCRIVVLSLTSAGRKLFNEINDRWEPRIIALIRFVGIDNLMATINTIKNIIDYNETLFNNDIEIDQVINQQADLEEKQSSNAPRSDKRCN